MVEVANRIADRYQRRQEWAQKRFAEDPREAEIARNSIFAVCGVGVVPPGGHALLAGRHRAACHRPSRGHRRDVGTGTGGRL